MNNETNQNQNEVVEIDKAEMEAVAATLPVRTKLRAGTLPACAQYCTAHEA
jgi:hypothetical protein